MGREAQLPTHGPSQVNERRMALGVTWMDSGKLYVVALLLLFVPFAQLYLSRENPRWWAKTAFALVVLALSSLVVGTALQFWLCPWGSYALSFETVSEQLGVWGGVLQALGSLLLAVGLVPFGIDLASAGLLPGWLVPVLVVGAATTLFLTPAFVIPAIAWLMLGSGSRSEKKTRAGEFRQKD